MLYSFASVSIDLKHSTLVALCCNPDTCLEDSRIGKLCTFRIHRGPLKSYQRTVHYGTRKVHGIFLHFSVKEGSVTVKYIINAGSSAQLVVGCCCEVLGLYSL